MKKTMLFVAVALATAGHAYASDSKPLDVDTSPYQVRLSVEPWSAETDFRYSFDSSKGDPRLGSNPTSELDFTGMKSSGVTISLDSSNDQFYYNFALSLGKGEGNSGQMVDDDYFSQQHVGAGNPTRFSRTLSDAQINDSFSLAYSSGWAFHPDCDYVDQARLGFGVTFSQQKFEAKGLIILEDPYNIYGSDKHPFDEQEAVIRVKNQQLLSSLDLGASKQFSNGFGYNVKTNLIFLGLMRSEDTHLKRTDLGSPSLVLNSVSYGLKADLTGTYTVDKLTFSAGTNYMFLAPYSKGTAEFFDPANNSLGSATIIHHDINQISYHAGVSYLF